MALAYGLIETADLTIPHLPPGLDGARVAQVSDLHVRRPQRWHGRLVNQLGGLHLDLVVFTGDYMADPGDEPTTLELLTRLCDRLRPAIGSFGVFGNHDTPELRHACADLPVHWLSNSCVRIKDHPLDLLGFNASRHDSADSVALALNGAENLNASAEERLLRIALSHYPTVITAAADMGVDVMFAGHSHGGQIRLPRRLALINSMDLPLGLTAGIMRHRQTLLAVSRGLGTAGLLAFRLFCPPHIPVYTLRRGPWPGQYTDNIKNIQPW